MSEYEKPYNILFNAVTDAIILLEEQNYGSTKALLIRARQQAEAAFLEFGEPKSEP